MKKIAFYIESLIIGGAEKVLIDLVNHLDPDKYEITVVSIFKNSVYKEYPFKFEEPFLPHVKYKWLIDNSKKIRYILFNYLFAHGMQGLLYKYLVKEKYDVEIAFYEGLPTTFVAYSVNEISKKYAWLHTDNRSTWDALSEKQLDELKNRYHQFDQVIGVSDIVVNSYHDFFPELPATTVYSPVNYKMILEKSQEKADFDRIASPLLLTVGRLIPLKGYGRLLKCLRRLNGEGYPFQLIMIGNGSEEEKLKSFVIEHDLSDKISFIGSQQNPYSYMKAADYFICSSFVEGMGMAIIESIICELPILATDCGGPKEIFGSDECGIIADNSEEGIYLMLKNAFDHPEERSRFQSECRKRRDFFKLDRRMEEINLLFED